MKGRKQHYNRPVYKNIAIESWVVDIMDECKKFGIRPNEIIEAGLISILKSSDKTPISLLRSFVNSAEPKANDFIDTMEYFKKLIQTMEVLPASTHKKELSEMPARTDKWFESFHALKVLEPTDTEQYILLLKSEYLKQPELFEIQDDNHDLNWNKLPRYYSIEAVMKVHSQNGSLKGDVPA